MTDNYVRDSDNVIKMYLTTNGFGDAILEKDISLYVGSYQNKLMNVFIPKNRLFENEENTFNYAVSVSALMTNDTGKKVTSKPYYLSYLKDACLLDPQTQEMTDYVVLERVLPKEFTVYVGTTTVVINVINLDNTDDPTMLDIITSQVCYLQVQESEYANDDEEVEPSEFQTLVSRVTTLEKNVDLLDNVISLGENFVTSLKGDKLPTNEELDVVVNNIENRDPRNGDVIIFTLTLENETDKSYKYFYSIEGWGNYEIPLIETASNGSLGIIQGTYSTNDEDVTTTEVNIRNGKILNLYVDLDGKKQELGEIFNETLPNKYLNQEIGASKQFVQDYAMPRQFNDVDFISSIGYQDNVPTEPKNGVQFTTTTNGIGDFEIFQIEKTNTANFELSSKNWYSNTIYISANTNCKGMFRLTTRFKKPYKDWIDLNIELTNTIEFNDNDIKKLVFTNPFTYLGKNVVDFEYGDMLQQTLEVITQTSVPITFSVYSNEIYPSSFSLTSQTFRPLNTVESVNGKTGVIELSAEDVGALPDDTPIFSGSYNDLKDKPEIPDVSEFITKSVSNLDNYYTKSQTYTKQEIDTAISNVEVDLSGYYTKTETDAITTQTLGSAKSYTDTKVADLINSAPETLDTIGEVAKAIQDNATVIDALNSAIGNKVDKIEGKGLSTNDYTTAEKTKLAGLSNYDDTSIKSSITTLETNKANKNEIPTNYVTTDTLQKITGFKTFTDVEITGTLKDDAGTSFSSLGMIQPKLTAGRGISIDGNTISSTAEDVSVKDQYGVALRPYTGGGANTTDNKDALSERAIATALPYINGRHDYTQSNEIYAPTTSGTTGQILVANSSSLMYGGWEEKTSGGTPSWKNPSELGLITETELTNKGYATQTSLNTTNSNVSANTSAITSFKNDKLYTSGLLDRFYPKYSIFMTTNRNDDPANLFGGEWLLVDAGKALWTEDPNTLGGRYLSAGLPNITGQFGLASGAGGFETPSVLTGAFSQGYTTSKSWSSASGTSYGVNFNANSGATTKGIYGNSTTVQPPAYTVFVWQRIG